MKISRTSRLVAAFLALVSMLFMQLAVASYVCPGHTTGSGTSGLARDISSAAMLDCAGMDQEQPALCHAHAEDSSTKQSLDKPQAPDVQPFVLAGLTQTLQLIDIVSLPQEHHAHSLHLARSTAPPITIRNCCFRI